MNNQDSLFLEEILESLPLIYTKVIALSNNYSPKVIVELKIITERLLLTAQQHRLIEVDNFLQQINLLSNSYQEAQTAAQKSHLIKQLWQNYTDFKEFILKKLSSSDLGMPGILTKGESFVGLISPLVKFNDLDLFQEIWDKDLVPIFNYLETALDNCNEAQLSPIFQQQIQSLLGLGELLELADLITITKVAIALQQSHPQITSLITKRTIACWRTAQTAYLQLSVATPQLQQEQEIDFRLFQSTDLQNQQISTIKTANYLLWLSDVNLFLIEAKQIQEIVSSSAQQIVDSNHQILFNWHSQLISLVRLSQLIKYNLPQLTTPSLPNSSLSQVIILKHKQEFLALEIEVEQLLVTPQLILQPFNPILTTPSYLLGCTVLENERLVTVIDVLILITTCF